MLFAWHAGTQRHWLAVRQCAAFILLPQFVGPALLVYGAMLLRAREAPAPRGNDRFGGVLAEAQADQRWKMRLLGVLAGLVQLWVIGVATRPSDVRHGQVAALTW